MKWCIFLLFIFVILAPIAVGAQGADFLQTFWHYTKDRYGRPVLTDPLTVPQDMDPYQYLAGIRGFDDWLVRRTPKATILAEKPSVGVVPILCLHKLGKEEKYSLFPDRFRRLLRYINDKGWYLISDDQYLRGDFSHVPTGLRPIVMGSDDASRGTLIYQTKGNPLTSPVRRLHGKPILDKDSMVAILEKLVPRENGRINFTFYLSFDAIPFRQLDAYKNPGFPYAGIPIVAEKIRYLDKNFILGIHSLSHIYAYEMGIQEFARDIFAAWALIDDYAGGSASTVRTMAFPYGIENLAPQLREALAALRRHGRALDGAFDMDGKSASAPGAIRDSFDISRINVDNNDWHGLLRYLETINAVTARRAIIWEISGKRLPQSRYALGAAPSDDVWVLIRPPGFPVIASDSAP